MRATSAILILAVGLLLAARIDRDTGGDVVIAEQLAPLARPSFSVSATPRGISLSGTTVSADHESALHSLARRQSGARVVDVDFRPGIVLAASWRDLSDQLLRVVATLDSAEVSMTPGLVDIRGVTSDMESTAARLENLRSGVPASVQLVTDILVVRSTASLDELCRKAFSAMALGPVSFMESSAEIRSASLVTLDRITEFAHDCPSAKIAITGHSDASGDEAANRALSLARAQAVADYLVSNGIEPQRLVVLGAGASRPVADNATAYGRQLNRRIEFELR